MLERDSREARMAHTRLRQIVNLCNIFAWVILAVYVLSAIVMPISDQYLYAQMNGADTSQYW